MLKQDILKRENGKKEVCGCVKINIQLVPELEEPELEIRAPEWTVELEELVRQLQQQKRPRLIVMDEEQSVVLEPESIDYFYAEQRKVFAKRGIDHFVCKEKLYHLEEQFQAIPFRRFSKSVVGNITQIERFELAFNGTLCVYFKSGNKEYISRNYVKAVRQAIERGGNN